MGRRAPSAGVGGRTQQAGTLVAAAILPITFQPTLMPRSALDQALVTGISTSLNYGLAVQTWLRPRPDEPLPRGGARTAACWLSATGLSGAVVGGLQELVARRGRP
jgi:uncharacterized membrane protein